MEKEQKAVQFSKFIRRYAEFLFFF